MALKKPSNAPTAKRIVYKTQLHNFTETDPYAWIRAKNWQEAMRIPKLLPQDIRDYLESENAWCDYSLNEAKNIRHELISELSNRINPNDQSAPIYDENWAYFTRFTDKKEHPKFIRKKLSNGRNEEILLDVNKERESHPFFIVNSTNHSPDHRFFSWSADINGSEEYTIQVLDTESNLILKDKILQTQGEIIWASDSKRFLYTKIDSYHRPSKVFEHRLGENPDRDQLIFEEKSAQFFVSISQSLNTDYGIISTNSHSLTSDSYLIDLTLPKLEPLLITSRQEGHDYKIAPSQNTLFIRSNRDNSYDYKILATPISSSTNSLWTEIVPHIKGRTILDILAFKDYLVWLERKNGIPGIFSKNLRTGKINKVVTSQSDSFHLNFSAGSIYFSNCLRFTYSSPSTPDITYDYDLSSYEKNIVRKQLIPSGHNPDKYIVRRIFAPSNDGVKIPISIITKKDHNNKPNPLILYGYGAYGTIIPTNFSSHIFSLVDRGFSWAIAHIRGGADCGLDWYLDGKLENKENTFNDYISCAEYLCQEGYTKPGMIGALGRSAGGMLMGVIANKRPELFKAIVAEVPFVDVLNTMCDESLPLTPPEWTEWGNPINSYEDFLRIKSYSPYDNIRDCDYPNILATGGISDPRVTYWEPAKWIAKLRNHNTSKNDILLQINLSSGHAGASGRYERLKEIALTYAFFLKSFRML